MYDRFKWTAISRGRNEVLKRYEPIQPYLMVALSRLVGADIFIDVGANIGTYSIFLSSLPNISKVYAFEASPRTFEELIENIKLNDLDDKIVAANKAVSDVCKKTEFGIISEYSGANSILSGSIHDTNSFSEIISVECSPLDSLVCEKHKKICIKIDVEGHEIPVLSGASSLLADNNVVLQIEEYKVQQNVTQLLIRSGYRRLFAIGPDIFLTNIGRESLGPQILIEAFEDAAVELIKSGFARPINGTASPIRLHVPGGVALELSGTAARAARRLMRLARLR